jgi:hypothetical protein
MSITSKYSIICDDVRTESNNKLIMIGVYTDKMTVEKAPFTLPSLCFYHAFKSDEAGTWPISFRLEHVASKELVEGMTGQGKMTLENKGQTTALFRFVAPKFPAMGLYRFILEIENCEPIITEFEVIPNAD